MSLSTRPSSPADDVIAGGAGDEPDGAAVPSPARFAMMPEAVIDAAISDAAFRVYVLLSRYGGTSGTCAPSRGTLAGRLGRSTDTIDRALRDLTTAGLLRVEARGTGQRRLPNRYHLRAHTAALGATGYRALPEDTTTPYKTQAGSASFNGMTVDVVTFATAKGQAQNTSNIHGSAGILPPGTSVSYAEGVGGQVTQGLDASGLTPTSSAQEVKTAAAVATALPGFSVLTVRASTK